MLLNENEMKEIVKDLKLVSIAKNNGYNGKFYDVKQYCGQHGIGVSVTYRKETKFYCHDGGKVSKAVLKGNFDVYDAVVSSSVLRRKNFCGVECTPTWELKMNLETGENKIRQIDEFHQPAIGKSILKLCWVGQITNDELVSKIKRVIRYAVKVGKVELK